jgi:hypothetical protein
MLTIEELPCEDCIWWYKRGECPYCKPNSQPHCYFDGKDTPPCYLDNMTTEMLLAPKTKKKGG